MLSKMFDVERKMVYVERKMLDVERYVYVNTYTQTPLESLNTEYKLPGMTSSTPFWTEKLM